MIDVSPAKHGVDNPQRRYTEKRPFESWAEIAAVAARLGSHYGPIVMFATPTGLRRGDGWRSSNATPIGGRSSSRSSLVNPARLPSARRSLLPAFSRAGYA
jgi:hypothetical protein